MTTLESSFAMLVQLWSDYICPWCYLGRDRTALLRSVDVDVIQLPFELHPELPPGGRAVPTSGRLAAVYGSIQRECAEVGLPFNPPTHVPMASPNSHGVTLAPPPAASQPPTGATAIASPRKSCVHVV